MKKIPKKTPGRIGLIVPTRMGDTLVSFLENEDWPRMQVVTKGKQQIPKKQFCGWKVC